MVGLLWLLTVEGQGEEMANYATRPMLHSGTEEQIAQLNKITERDDPQVVFLGDSITHGFHGEGQRAWQKYWAPLRAANFGISGDRTEHVLWRLEAGNLHGLRPKVIVLMVGTNNAGQQGQPQRELGGQIYRCTAEQTAQGIGAILAKLKELCPQAKILLLAIFPRGEKWTDAVRQQNERTNALLKGYADGQAVFYLDINAKFLTPRGVLSREIMPDLLHPSAKGYEIWSAEILPVVTAWVAP